MAFAFKKTYISAAVAVTVLLGGAVGLAGYSSQRVASEVQSVAAAHTAGEWVVRNLAHTAGWGTSKGALDLDWNSPCLVGTQEAATTMHLEYEVSHWPSWQGLNRVEWKLAPTGAALEKAQAMGLSALAGKGAISYGGMLKTDMSLPALRSQEEGADMQIAPSSGRLEVGSNSVYFSWLFDRVALNSESPEALELSGMRLSFDLQDRKLGTGSGNFSIENLKADGLEVKGVRVSAVSSELNEKSNHKITEAVKSVEFQGKKFKDFVLEMELKDLHAPSARTLAELVNTTCLLRLSDEQSLAMRSAVKKLLTSGMTLGISKLQASDDTGRIDGHMQVKLAPSGNDEVQLAQQISSSGKLSVQSKQLPEPMRQWALGTGYFKEDKGVLQAHYQYAQGALTVTDKQIDASSMEIVLQKAQAMIRAFLNGESLEEPMDGEEEGHSDGDGDE